jgi:hypothetical protein
MKKYKRIYINGASDSAGGGLYKQTAKDWYKNNHNLKYENEKDVTFGKFLADELNYEYVNDALCGSGAPRLVRTTFDFIREVGIEEAKKTIFILQIHNVISRLEYYCNEINDYVIVNTGYYPNGKLEWIETSNDYANPNNSLEFYENISKELSVFLKKYHNPMLYNTKIKMEFIGLFSFLKLYNIPFFLELSDNFFWTGDSKIDNSFFPIDFFDKHSIKIDGYGSVGAWATGYNKLLMHETNNYCNDNHPGIYAHKEYGKKLKKFLEEKLVD